MTESRFALTRYQDFYQMLSDSVRMEAYERAIAASVQPGDVVVDLGAGTGVLGFFALRAGARKVYAIEKSDAIELARALATHNALSDRIELVNQSSKRVELPEPADVVVSETLGSFGIDESTLDFTIDARKRLLKPGGVLVPRGLRLFLAPVEASEIYRKLDFWRDVAGFDFSPAREVFSRKLMVETIGPQQLMTPAAVFGDIDLSEHEQASYQNRVYFQFPRSGTVHGFAGWFAIDLAEGVSFSTAPDQPITHWKQAFFPIAEPISVVARDVLELTMRISPKARDSDDTHIAYDYRCTQLGKQA